MVRKSESKGSGNNAGGSRIRFRYVDIEAENVDETVAEGLKSLAQALSRGQTVPHVPKQLAPTRAAVTSKAELPEGELEAELEDNHEELEEEEENGEAPEGKPKKRSTPKAPKFLSEINLTTATVQLEDFVKEKDPSDSLAKYLVIAFWYKEYLKIEETTGDHIFTAYTHLKWQSQMPDDPMQPFRDGKSKKNWFDKGSKGAYKINWNGINAVNKIVASAQ
jgi:hypothetical protein